MVVQSFFSRLLQVISMELRWKLALNLIAIIIGIFIAYSAPGLEVQAQVVLAILLVSMVLWFSELIPLHVTALLAAFLLVAVAGFPPAEVYNPFFEPVIVLLLGGFVLARALQKHGLDEYIALKFLKRTGSSPNKFLFGIMVVTAFLSMWISNTASAAVILPIGIVILSKNKLKPLKSNFGKALVLGIAFSATVGGIGTLVGSTPNVIAAKFLNESGIEFGFVDWMWYGVPMVIVLIPIIWVVLTRVYKPEIKKLKTIPFDKKLNKKQKSVLVIFAITVLMWLTTGLHGIPANTVSLIPIILLYLTGLLNTKDFSKINWAVLILIGGGLTLGLAMNSVGLDILFANILQTLIINQPIFFVFVIIGLFAIFMTIFASNTAAAAVMIPVMIPLALSLGLDVRTIVIIAAIGVSLDFIVPVGTPPSAIAYSSGFVRVKDMVKAGVILAFLGVVALASLALLYW